MHDPRPRLSASQQAQILSDVQQHQQRYRRPIQDSKNSRISSFPTHDQANAKYQQSNTPYSSLAKYKVDRAKQQQIQLLQQQQQQVQQLLQQQQQKIAQQLSTTDFANGNAQIPPFQRQQYQQQQYNQYQNGFQNLHQDLSQPLFSDQQTLQLQEYLEKQRELESLQKQRQQLLYEQQELRRQQELLRLQQLQRLTSTTSPPPPPLLPTSIATSTPVVVSTTSSPVLLSSPSARQITPSEAELFLKAIANHQKKYTTTTTSTTTTTTTTQPPPLPTPVTSKTHQETSSIPENLLGLIQDQESQLVQQGKPKPQIKVIYQTDRPSTTRQSSSNGRSRNSHQSGAALSLERELLLKQLKLALAQSGDDDVRNVTTRDLILPNGKKLQVIHAPNGLSSIVPSGSTAQSLILSASPTTTIKPPKAIFEELTKGVLPPGADFEVIRQKSDGKLEEIGKTPIQSLPAKKVTFVVLEEQPDGSYKVQGVKGNAEKESGTDVDSIVERIKKGELKLPPSSLNPSTPSTFEDFESSIDPNLVSKTASSHHSVSTSMATFRPTTVRSTSTHNEG